MLPICSKHVGRGSTCIVLVINLQVTTLPFRKIPLRMARTRVSQNSVPRRIFGPLRGEVTGEY